MGLRRASLSLFTDSRLLSPLLPTCLQDSEPTAAVANSLDFIIDTVSAPHSLSPYFALLKTNASYCCVGVPPESFSVNPGELIFKRIKLGTLHTYHR